MPAPHLIPDPAVRRPVSANMTPLNPKLGDPSQTLYLVDISSFIFRAFFAVRSLHNKAGEPTNAIYGVATMLSKLNDEAKPEYLAVLYDSPEPSFREQIYPEYKANRSAPPDDLVPQFARIEELIQAFEIHSYRQPGVEADDLIATLTRRWTKLDPKHRVVIVSSDKDLMQLVNDRVVLWDTMSAKVYGPPEVEEKFGVRPDQIRDYLALVGDSSDNIPGVKSIGPKSAVDLLKAHETLGGVLKAAEEGKIPGKKGEVLKTHKDDALISAELATVHEELELKVEPQDFKYHFHVTPACVDFLRRMDFHSLVNRWLGEAPVPIAKQERPRIHEEPRPTDEPPKPGVQGELDFSDRPAEVAPPLVATSRHPDFSITSSGDIQFKTVNREADFQALLQAIEKKKSFAFDIESTSLNPREAIPVGVAIAVEQGVGHYIPVGHRGTDVPQLDTKRVLDGLKPFLESSKYGKIGQNLKYDWNVLYQQGIRPDGILADTMVASYVLDPEGRHNLDTLAGRYLNYNVLTYEEVCGKGKDQLCFDQVAVDVATRYSAEDAVIALRLWQRFEPLLKKEGLVETFEKIDLPLVSVLARMEREGVNIDVSWLEKLSTDFDKDLKKIEERVQAYTKGPINLNSTKQLATLLFDELKLPPQGKTKTGFSTDAQVLDALSPLHEVPRLLLEYREISKLKGTYVDPLPTLRDARTGKIHAGFHQTVAATGRLSSADPNLQNIPIRTERGKLIRRAFVPSPDNELLSADYSQIELRLLAHMSKDPDLSESFRKDEDVHRRTASEIFGIKPEAVTDAQRGIAKAINFGLMYGKTAFGLAQELKIPRREAQDVIDRYFKRYKQVKHYLDHLIVDARDRGYAETLAGRKRFLPDLRSANPAIRNNAERMAMNTPIQGTAADLMKLAMIEIDRRLASEGFKSRLIIQVHDEVVLDCPKNEVRAVQKMVCEVMEGSMKLDVPLRTNAGTGANWMEL
jgi:DNA polymerase I